MVLVVRRLYRIEGVVVDEKGSPLSVTKIRYVEPDVAEPWGVTTSGGRLAAGRFESDRIGARRVRILLEIDGRWHDAGIVTLPADPLRLVIRTP